MTVLLVALALMFAVSMGAHYAGAIMGIPHALGAFSARAAVLVAMPLVFCGAAFASLKVQHTVVHLTTHPLTVATSVIVLAVATSLTILYTYIRIPTATIQLFTGALIGAALVAGDGVNWHSLGKLVLVWIGAPIVAAFLGFMVAANIDYHGNTKRDFAVAHVLLLSALGGVIASFTLGANDISNAMGVTVSSGTLSPHTAALIGGVAMASGVVIFGKRMLHRMAFNVVDIDPITGMSAQLVHGCVILLADGFGFFTSMQQALIGALIGAGAARDEPKVIKTEMIKRIAIGWPLGFPSAFLLAAVLRSIL